VIWPEAGIDNGMGAALDQIDTLDLGKGTRTAVTLMSSKCRRIGWGISHIYGRGNKLIKTDVEAMMLSRDEGIGDGSTTGVHSRPAHANRHDMSSRRRNKRVLLIDPTFRELAFGDRWEPSPRLAPPLGLMYLATPLIEAGFDVEFIDLNVERFTVNQFVQKVRNRDFVGLTCFSASLESVQKLIPIIRKANPQAYIMCGGPYCTLSEKPVAGADLTAVGEAEEYIVEILQRLVQERSLEGIPGIIYREKGELIRNKGIMQVKDLNLNRPASFELAQDKEYGDFLGMRLRNITGMITSRGCPFRCAFCTNIAKLPYRARAVDNVVEEVQEYYDRGYKYLAFYDDNILFNKRRAMQIMDEIIKREIRMKITVFGRVDSADQVLYRKLKEAGVLMIMFGIESANQDVLDFYHKQVTVQQIREAVRMCNQMGIMSYGWFIIGAPMETREHFENDLRLANETHLDLAYYNVLGYREGSKLWEDACRKGLIEEHETIVWANEKLSNFTYEELCAIKADMTERFYLDFARVLRIIYKFWRLNELFHLLKLLLRNNYVRLFTNPYEAKSAPARIAVERLPD
jgi:anaerobic magnesium-protoporphyrin IX monomethyl ester cyclase